MIIEGKRDLAALAREALAVQDACNLSGVVHSWSRVMTELRAVLVGQFNTDTFNRHPINVLFASKVACLTGCEVASQFALAYEACCVLEVRKGDKDGL